MVRPHDGVAPRFGQWQVDGGAVAKVRGERGVQEVGEQSLEVVDASLETKALEVGADVEGGAAGGGGAGEVGAEGEGAEVGGDGGVGWVGQE